MPKKMEDQVTCRVPDRKLDPSAGHESAGRQLLEGGDAIALQ